VQDHADTDQARYEREHAAWQRDYAGSRPRGSSGSGDGSRAGDRRGDDWRDRRPQRRESWLSELFD
jgi:hypothetical protein